MNSRAVAIRILISALYLAGQLATGTDALVAVLLACAIGFGLVAIDIGGGLTSAIGVLNAILLARFLLIGVAMKTILGDPADEGLKAPLTTALVMALGFFGVMVGTAIVRRLPGPSRSLIPEVNTPRDLFVFAIVILVVCNLSYYYGIRPDLEGQGLQVGGMLGVARLLGGLKSLAIIPAILFAWCRSRRNCLVHPFVLGVLGFEVIVGLLTTSKQAAIEPLVIYLTLGFVIRGFRDLKLWSVVVMVLLGYAFVIYPYSQYIRNHGGRDGSLIERLSTIEETLWGQLTEPEVRAMETKALGGRFGYLGRPELAGFDRLAMIGEADRLIAGTDNSRAFTEWETVAWGINMLLPRIINSDKPAYSAANFLSHIAGDAVATDETTQWAYGSMANFYNAFSFLGVFVGCTGLFAAFYYYNVKLWFGNPKWKSTPLRGTLWLFFVVGVYHHILVESDVAGLISMLPMAFLVAALYAVSAYLRPFVGKLIPNRRFVRAHGRQWVLRAAPAWQGSPALQRVSRQVRSEGFSGGA